MGAPNTAALTPYANLILGTINGIIVPVLFAIAFIVFLYGVADAYILHPGNEEKRKEGHRIILWGVIGFVVMVSLWGLVNVFAGTLGLTGNIRPPYPVI